MATSQEPTPGRSSLEPESDLIDWLEPLQVNGKMLTKMSEGFMVEFTNLAEASSEQFLPTPILESMLPKSDSQVQGRYLAVDIGGTNLRVGFIELGVLPPGEEPKTGPDFPAPDSPRLRRVHEVNWAIPERLKKQGADELFNWIGDCIGAVVIKGVKEGYHNPSLNGKSPADAVFHIGVTFSFPVEQDVLWEAKITSLGKGFHVERGADLPALLVHGYDAFRSGYPDPLPRIEVAAIANDSVSTLVAFQYEFETKPHQKAVMGVICGTGTNATIPMKVKSLGAKVKQLNGTDVEKKDGDKKVIVNTEWSINGSKPPLSAAGIITSWDEDLSASLEIPGFQPLEYMTSGRYLGEVCRRCFEGWLLHVGDPLPAKMMELLRARMMPFLIHYRPPPISTLNPPSVSTSIIPPGKPTDPNPPSISTSIIPPGSTTDPRGAPLLKMLEDAFPTDPGFDWTEKMALQLYHIVKAVQVRAAGIMAAAIVGLLESTDELSDAANAATANGSPGPEEDFQPLELVVGYTGSCITNFHEYFADCQDFLNEIVNEILDVKYQGGERVKVVLRPVDNGGIKGAGILVPAALKAKKEAEEMANATGILQQMPLGD